MERTVHWTVKRDTIIKRYTIADATTGCTLDDAVGYGFKDYEKAYNYAFNKYKCPPVVDERPMSCSLF